METAAIFAADHQILCVITAVIAELNRSLAPSNKPWTKEEITPMPLTSALVPLIIRMLIRHSFRDLVMIFTEIQTTGKHLPKPRWEEQHQPMIMILIKMIFNIRLCSISSNSNLVRISSLSPYLIGFQIIKSLNIKGANKSSIDEVGITV